MRKNSLELPKLIAHRGYAVEAPQNSIPAFVEAGKLGFWAVETDVHKTKDGVLVCNHNNSVDEMYYGSGKIAEMTYRELATLESKQRKMTLLILRGADDPNVPRIFGNLQSIRRSPFY